MSYADIDSRAPELSTAATFSPLDGACMDEGSRPMRLFWFTVSVAQPTCEFWASEYAALPPE